MCTRIKVKTNIKNNNKHINYKLKPDNDDLWSKRLVVIHIILFRILWADFPAPNRRHKNRKVPPPPVFRYSAQNRLMRK